MCCVVAGVCIAAMAPLPLAFRPTANSNLDPAWIAAGVDSGLGRILPRSSSSRATCDAMATAPCRSLADRYSRRRMASRDCARARQRESVIGNGSIVPPNRRGLRVIVAASSRCSSGLRVDGRRRTQAMRRPIIGCLGLLFICSYRIPGMLPLSLPKHRQKLKSISHWFKFVAKNRESFFSFLSLSNQNRAFGRMKA